MAWETLVWAQLWVPSWSPHYLCSPHPSSALSLITFSWIASIFCPFPASPLKPFSSSPVYLEWDPNLELGSCDPAWAPPLRLHLAPASLRSRLSCHALCSSLNPGQQPHCLITFAHILPAVRILFSASSHGPFTSLRSRHEWTLLRRNSFYSPRSEGLAAGFVKHTEPVKTEWFGISGWNELCGFKMFLVDLPRWETLPQYCLAVHFWWPCSFVFIWAEGWETSTQAAGERGWPCQGMGVWQPRSSPAGSSHTFTVALVLS